ncbi:ureidoglycolate lyase [Salinicola endophyticus]|uniref:Ureidoglycolate lyase n=1 Tax=Salinicola endophyticus TaxID=1949083 RepID=A0ABY8FMF1_9GAMM|nr:ureidoglycolate lyase [Salinicola endophyticus]WFF41064.1 ureidoglycolate lyase [Salinicola endophyticus]
MQELNAQPLTAAAFAPFGEVIDARVGESFAINGGRTQRHHALAKVDIRDAATPPLISIFVSQPVTLPLEVALLERHPLGSQAFMPLHEERFVVVVAPPGDDIDPSAIRAFVTDGRQGVNYRAGTWHAIHSVLEREGEFLVVDRGGADNLDEREMNIRIVVP